MAEAKTIELTVEPEIGEEVEALARSTQRSTQDVVRDALVAYLDVYNANARLIERRLAEDDAGEPVVEHEQVTEWVRSWGTADEKPRPKGVKTR